jgi:hypothetical protein
MIVYFSIPKSSFENRLHTAKKSLVSLEFPAGYKKRIIDVDIIHSPTEREERNQHDGSSPERVPGKQGEIPRPLRRKMRQRLLSPGLALGY